MYRTLPRWRDLGAATVAVVSLTGTVGCSGGASTPSTSGTNVPSPPAVGSPDPAASAALSKALSTTRALRSYTFRATQTITGGTRAQVTTVTGRAVRPAAISYDLTVGGNLQQVVKVGGRTYLRTPPATWKALTKPGSTVDPLDSLLVLLTNLQQPRLLGSSLTGQVSAQVLSRARLAPSGAEAGAATPVTFVLDAADHVTTVTLRVTVRAGTQTLMLDGKTSFRQFNTAPAIAAPQSAGK